MKAGLSVKAYASYRREKGLPGSSPRAVEIALKSGRIKRGKDNKIHPKQADADWQANTDHSKRPPHSEPGAKKRRGAKLPDSALGKDTLTLADAKALHETIKVREKEIAHLERIGSLVLAADVEKFAAKRDRETRDAVLAVPAKIAAEVHAAAKTGGVRKVERLIQEALRGALERLARDAHRRAR